MFLLLKKLARKSRPPRIPLSLIFLLINLINLSSLEISRDKVYLILHEDSARFSLYGLNVNGVFETFLGADPKTSFLELNVDNRIYRLGDASAFRFRIEDGADSLAFVFESEDLEAREEFSFIKTAGSHVYNGIQISVVLRNRRDKPLSAGFRLLLDTALGEGNNRFLMNNQNIPGETLVGGNVTSSWISKGPSLSFMGSVARPSGPGVNPNYLYFTNQRRVSEASWKSAYSAFQSSTQGALSDSAVIYYYEPVSLPPNGEIRGAILLASEDPSGFSPNTEPFMVRNAATTPAPRETLAAPDPDLALLRRLVTQIDSHITENAALQEDDLAEMERIVSQMKELRNLP